MSHLTAVHASNLLVEIKKFNIELNSKIRELHFTQGGVRPDQILQIYGTRLDFLTGALIKLLTNVAGMTIEDFDNMSEEGKLKDDRNQIVS